MAEVGPRQLVTDGRVWPVRVPLGHQSGRVQRAHGQPPARARGGPCPLPNLNAGSRGRALVRRGLPDCVLADAGVGGARVQPGSGKPSALMRPEVLGSGRLRPVHELWTGHRHGRGQVELPCVHFGRIGCGRHFARVSFSGSRCRTRSCSAGDGDQQQRPDPGPHQLLSRTCALRASTARHQTPVVITPSDASASGRNSLRTGWSS
jgi:hypothetical protein